MTSKQLLKYFECRPETTELYLVGRLVFSDKMAADKYALQVSGSVETKQKSDVEAAAEAAETWPEEMTAEEAKEKVVELELTEDFDYYKMQDLVQALELDTESRSKADYLAALLNFKASLSDESSIGEA